MQKDASVSSMVRAIATGVRTRTAWAICHTFAVGICSAATAAAQTPEGPTFDQVGQAVVGYFRTIPGFQQGDLVSQSQVAAALRDVNNVGWSVPDAEQIVARALPDDSFLIQQSRTPDGKKFMREVARSPGGYSRLDRLSSISRGHKLIRELITDKDGYLMIEYLATTPGGHELGKMMAETPDGVNLNKPTGRIYTIEDLLRVLAEAYSAAHPQ